MKKFISFMCIIALLIGLMPSAIVMADNSKPTIEVVSLSSYAGGTADVILKMTNNPGVASALLKVGYDTNYLTLEKVTDGGMLGGYAHSNKYTASPYTLSWENDTVNENFKEDGNIVTLTFKVSENAPLGKLNIYVFSAECLNVEKEEVNFSVINGVIDIKDYIIGDVNEDAEVNTKDRMFLSRHLANWTGYENVNKKTSDVNGDDVLNTKDRMFLSRHLASWSGYEVFPYVSSAANKTFVLNDVLKYTSPVADGYDESAGVVVQGTEGKIVVDGEAYTISKDATIYYNGIELSDVSSTSYPGDNVVINKSGTIELYSTNVTSTSDFDTVYINAYDTFVVDSILPDESMVIAKSTTSAAILRICYDESNQNVKAKLLNAKGKAIKWTDLKEDDVLSVKYVEADKLYYEARVINKKVEGIVSEIEESVDWKSNPMSASAYKYVWIDGVEYSVLPFAEMDKVIKLESNGTYYLDGNNNIVYYNQVGNFHNYSYAYVISAQNESGMDSAKIKMITENGTAIYDVASRIYVTAMDINGNGLYERSSTKLYADGREFDLISLVDSLIAFKTNDNGDIISVETALDIDNNHSYDGENYFTINNGGQITTLRNYNVLEDTKIFDISGDDIADWGTVSAADIMSSASELKGAYVYNVDYDNNVGAIVFVEDNGLEIKTTTPVVNNVSGYVANAQNESGMNNAKIKVLTKDGIKIYEVASKIRVNSKYINGEDSYVKLPVDGESFDLTMLLGAFITFNIGSDDIVVSIDDAEYLDNKVDLVNYNAGEKSFADGTKLKDNTLIFDVSGDYEGFWGTVSVSSITDGQSLLGASICGTDNEGYVEVIFLSQANNLPIRTGGICITGMVDEVLGTPGSDDRRVAINGYTFNVLAGSEDNGTFAVGSDVVCYLDTADNIYDYKIANYQYGYVLSGDGVKVKLILPGNVVTSTNEGIMKNSGCQIFELADYVIVNGGRYEAQSAFYSIKDNIVSYMLDDEGKICLVNSFGTYNNRSLYEYNAFDKMFVYGNYDEPFAIDDSKTMAICIPRDISNATEDDLLVPVMLLDNINYCVNAYDVDENSSIASLVVLQGNMLAGMAGYVSSSSDVGIVKNVSRMAESDKEQLVVNMLTKYGEVNFPVDMLVRNAEDFASLNQGDLIAYSLVEGSDKLNGYKSIQGANNYYANYLINQYQDDEVCIGTVTDCRYDIISYAQGTLVDRVTINYGYNTVSYDVANADTPPIFLFEDDCMVKEITFDDIQIGDKIFVSVNVGNVRAIVIKR